MIKVNVLCVGKIKEDFFRAAIAEYSKRLSRFCNLEITEIPEGKTIEEEGKAIIRRMRGYTFALCVEGKPLSSPALADRIKGLVDRGENLTFIIGSSEGLSDEVKSAADFKLSFSEMTFPHQLMRVILLEQIYRAFMINGGGEYHK